mgnify:CR=1 FL=1
MTIPMKLHQELLEAEGIVLNANGKCDLGEFQWFPEGFEPENDIQPSLLV